jgi:hypothetical protein
MAQTRSRKGIGGYKPRSPTGEVRDRLLAFKVSPTELELINAMLVKRGYTPDNAGLRDFLLATSAADAAQLQAA